MNLLIVDDETLARERLQKLVLEINPAISVFTGSDGLDALNKISTYSPEIILLDIRMPGMDGLELANHLLHLTRPPAIIFTTAYQDHAISAFDANAVDYLLKPIRKERLKIAMERATAVSQSTLHTISKISNMATKRTHLSTLIKGDIQLIPIAKIYYLKAEQKYVTVVWSGGDTLIDEPLIALEAEFQDDFIRIHRNTLVAIKYINSLSKKAENKYMITLSTSPTELPVSRRHLHAIRAIIKSH